MFSGIRRRIGHHSHWNMAFTKILLRLCDVQLLTGFGLLFSSFVSLSCYMSAYHWQIMSYLAWFSNLTHAACLTALLEYLYQHQLERNFRMTLMVVLLAGLRTAIIPTGYFNWQWAYYGTAAVPASNARCFFTQDGAQKVWESRACPKDSPSWFNKLGDGYRCNFREVPLVAPKATAAYESSILSIVLLTFSFASRSVKMFRTLSEITKYTVRQKMGLWASSVLIATARAYEKLQTTTFRKRLLNFFRPLDLMLALYLVVKLYLDVFSSEMADVSGL
ncbi:hypothetical protein CGCSCA5_v002589 [Colletotrichum siamense]|nr:hypothetical protein CGCSCA5_v002589 [Colletotrichum siamense]